MTDSPDDTDVLTGTFDAAPPAATSPLLPPDSGGGQPGGGGGRRGGGMVLLGALLLGVVGGIGGVVLADRQGWIGSDGVTVKKGTITVDRSKTVRPAAPAGELTPNQIYTQSSPGVVHVRAQVTVQSQSFFGQQEQRGESSGSGFVIDDTGHIVTNAHVVEGAEKVSISFASDKEFPATIVGRDESTDIAVLKLEDDADLEDALTPLSFADSQGVEVGDSVVAIGNPFNLDRTLTTGVISALQRQLQAPNGFSIDNVLQTDAAINPGNSGGPLFDMQGRVIGVNSQIQSSGGGNDGIGFAVPSNTVQKVADELISGGSVKHAWLGVQGNAVDEQLADLFNLPVKQGVLIEQVTEGSPADAAGLKGGEQQVTVNGETWVLGGDVVTEIDGTEIESMRQLADLINSKDPGEKIEITFLRDGKEKSETLTLGTRPAGNEPQ